MVRGREAVESQSKWLHLDARMDQVVACEAVKRR